VRIEEGVPLARMTTVGIGGPAAALARPRTLAELEEALDWAARRGLDVRPIGLGSNLLAADAGVDSKASSRSRRCRRRCFSPEAERPTPSAFTVPARPASADSSSPVRSPAPPAEAFG